MDLLLDSLQGIGVSAAAGIRPFLPAVLVGLLALLDLGVDFDDTSFAFLEHPAWLVGLALAAAALHVAGRRLPEAAQDRAGLGIAAVLGALLFAGTLDDRHETWWPGLLAGALIAAGVAVVAGAFFRRVRARMGEDGSLLPAYGEAAGGLAAGLSVALPPLALVVLGFIAFLARGGKRREGEKYAGLRILR